MKDLYKTLILAVVPATILAISIAWTFRYQELDGVDIEVPLVLDRWSGSIYVIAGDGWFKSHVFPDGDPDYLSLHFVGIAEDLTR